MTKLTLKEREMNVLRWTDNCSEMKHFCGKYCKITYEICGVDDYWLLKVYDSLKEKEVIVAIGDYVVEYSDGLFTVMNNAELEEWFEICGVYEPKDGVITTEEEEE